MLLSIINLHTYDMNYCCGPYFYSMASFEVICICHNLTLVDSLYNYYFKPRVQRDNTDIERQTDRQTNRLMLHIVIQTCICVNPCIQYIDTIVHIYRQTYVINIT